MGDGGGGGGNGESLMKRVGMAMDNLFPLGDMMKDICISFCFSVKRKKGREESSEI